MEQVHVIVEAVVMAFMIGGIVGAVAALHLRSGSASRQEDARMTPDAVPAKTRDAHTRRR